MTRAEILHRLRAAGIEPGEDDLAHFEATLPAFAAAREAVRVATTRMPVDAPGPASSPPSA
ncbi:MAG: hypothetical protein ACKOGH_07705 [Alphaproteobacteria bacterium]